MANKKKRSLKDFNIVLSFKLDYKLTLISYTLEQLIDLQQWKSISSHNQTTLSKIAQPSKTKDHPTSVSPLVVSLPIVGANAK